VSRGTRDPSNARSRVKAPVAIGAGLLLLGAVSVVVLVGCGGDRSTNGGPGKASDLVLSGVPDDMLETLQVTVRWREPGQTEPLRQDAEPVAGSPGTFRLPPAAHGRKVEIDVVKQDVIIVRKALELAGDSTLRIDLLKEPAYREVER